MSGFTIKILVKPFLRQGSEVVGFDGEAARNAVLHEERDSAWSLVQPVPSLLKSFFLAENMRSRLKLDALLL